MKEVTWKLRIALEHENDPKSWMDEVIKLMHISCDLRIVIAYSKYNSKEQEDAEKENIRSISKTIKELGFEFSKGQEFLLILGNAYVKIYDSFNKINYRGYKLNTEKIDFERLESDPRWK